MIFNWNCNSCRDGVSRNSECPVHGIIPITIPLTHPSEATNLQEMIMDGQTLATGIKKDEGKPRMDLLSSIALFELTKVLTFGCTKYSPNNWRLGISWGRVIGAALRHIFSWMKGEDKDLETGLSHLAHAMCCLMFLLEYELTRKEFDDRYKVGNSTV